MVIATQVPELVQQKLEAFEQMQAEFEQCFRFGQEVHGRKRFPSFPIRQIVAYLHALWMCEQKDRLLSIYRNIRRYEGQRGLELLQAWQNGKSAEVVEFLTRKLDMFPFAIITAQIEDARTQQGNETLAQRLEHGRRLALNRAMNLVRAHEAIFSLDQEALLKEVRAASEQVGHTPAQISKQLADLDAPLYAYRPHQLLAQRNMAMMNKLEVDVLNFESDVPGERPRRIGTATGPGAPLADQIIDGYLPLLAPLYNNVRQVRFTDRPGLEVSASS